MTAPHLFASSCDGALYDTREPIGAAPVRRNYSGHPQQVASLADVKAALRAGEFAWPGGYQLYFSTRDGAALSFKAAREQFANVADDFLSDSSTGWRIDGVHINHEDSDLVCDHTGDKIPASYGEDS